MLCSTCSSLETQITDTGIRIEAKHPRSTTDITCSRCIQKTYQETLEEEPNGRKTKKTRGAVDRRRALQTTRSSHHKIRQKPTIK